MFTRKEIPVKYNDVVVAHYEVMPLMDPDTQTLSMIWSSFDFVAGENRPESDVIAYVQSWIVENYPNRSSYDGTTTEIVVPLMS